MPRAYREERTFARGRTGRRLDPGQRALRPSACMPTGIKSPRPPVGFRGHPLPVAGRQKISVAPGHGPDPSQARGSAGS
jgi:hypothetical protein